MQQYLRHFRRQPFGADGWAASMDRRCPIAPDGGRGPSNQNGHPGSARRVRWRRPARWLLAAAAIRAPALSSAWPSHSAVVGAPLLIYSGPPGRCPQLHLRRAGSVLTLNARPVRSFTNGSTALSPSSTSTGAAIRTSAGTVRRQSSCASTALVGETPHPELIALVAEIVAEGLRGGELRGQHVGAQFIATMVANVLAGCVANWFDMPDIDLRAAVKHTLDLILTRLQEG